MANMSDYLETQLINHLFRTNTFTKPTVIAIALCTTAPTDTSTGATIAEVSNTGTAYVRQTLNPDDSSWTATSSGTTSNSSLITFPVASADYNAAVTHIAILDSATYGAGNVLFWGVLASSKTIANGDQFSFAISSVRIQIDN